VARAVKNTGLLLILLIFGSIFGSLIGEVLSDIIPVLNYGKTIGFAPVTIDLAAVSLTFGILIKINLAAILGFFIAFFIYTRM
jgi:hypothetical protein